MLGLGVFWARVLRQAPQPTTRGDQETAARNMLELPLLALDPDIARFADTHDFAVTANQKDWPERSLHRPGDVECLMQIFLVDPKELTWKLWICAWQDRAGTRYWRRQTLIDGERVEAFKGRFRDALEAGKLTLDDWCGHPDSLRPATEIRR